MVPLGLKGDNDTMDQFGPMVCGKEGTPLKYDELIEPGRLDSEAQSG